MKKTATLIAAFVASLAIGNSAMACTYHFKVVNATDYVVTYGTFASDKNSDRVGATEVSAGKVTLQPGESATGTASLTSRKANNRIYTWLIATVDHVYHETGHFKGSPTPKSCYESYQLKEAGTPVTFTVKTIK